MGSYVLDLNVSSEELTELELINIRATLAAEYMTNNEGKFLKDELMPVFQDRFRDALSEMNTRLQWRIQDFSKGGDFCKRGVTIHCPITKICDLGAFFLCFSFVLAQNRGGD